MAENEWFSLSFSSVFITPLSAGGILSLFLSGKMAGVSKKSGFPLFVLVINKVTIYHFTVMLLFIQSRT